MLGRGRRASLPEGARVALLLAPAMVVVLGFFAGGLVLALMQSLNYFPLIGLDSPNFDAYRGAWSDPAFTSSLLFTLRVSFVATVVSAVLAIAAGLLIRETRRGRRVLTFIFQLNLPIPHIVGAVAMLFLLSQSGLVARFAAALGMIDQPADFPALVADEWGIAITAEYVWKEVPFIGVVVLAALAGGIEEYEDAARSLGAGRWQRFRYVTLPLIMPAVLSTSIIVFAFSFGSFEVPWLLGASQPAALPVLSYQYYIDLDLQNRPEAMAINIMIAVMITALVIAYMMMSDRYIRRRAA
jgi:putative spermidine/putrescine transport system permease protein